MTNRQVLAWVVYALHINVWSQEETTGIRLEYGMEVTIHSREVRTGDCRCGSW